MKHKDLDLKILNCVYAYRSYQHLLNTIKDNMRGGKFERDSLLTAMNNIDNYVVDTSPVFDKYLLKYKQHFT